MSEISEKQKNLARLAVMLLGVFMSSNWIYGRTQLSGFMPLPISLMILAGSVYQTYALVGTLLESTVASARKLSLVGVLIISAVALSALTIYWLSQDTGPSLNSGTEILTPIQENSVPGSHVSAESDGVSETVPPLFIEVRVDTFVFGPNGGTTQNLQSIIKKYQELIALDPLRPVVVVATKEIAFKRVADVMYALKEAGAKNISLSTSTTAD